MDKNTISSSTTNNKKDSGTFPNQDTNLELPPPYSPTQQEQAQHSIPSSSSNIQQNNLPNDHPSFISDTHPSAPSLYPDIPQRLPHCHNVIFPIPQPPYSQLPHQQYQQHQQKFHQDANMSTPLYQHTPHIGYQPQQQNGILYGSTQHHYSSHTSPPPPAGFHTIYISGHQTSSPQPHRFAPPIDSIRRPFPIGALVFIFGWAFPPLWILGACCCAASRNPYEAWWARLNLFMGLLVLLSSLIYSMLAILVGDWNVGLQWFALRQEA